MVKTPSQAYAEDRSRPRGGAATEDTIAATALTGHSGGDVYAEETWLAEGTAVGRYIVVGQLGSGGMGVVYVAWDPELERRVALKLLRRKTEPGSKARRRLLREAQALARLSHPNVVAVHDVGEHDGQIFLAMEFVEGQTLRKWLKAEERSLDEIISMLVRAGRGLVVAHDNGIVHRDFKPDNVMVSNDGRVRVMDFGLARAGESALSLTSSGLSISSHDSDVQLPVDDEMLTGEGKTPGTPAYMAPEQHLSRGVDERTDQFSFCVTLYEAIYGVRPFTGDSLAALSWSVTEGKLGPTPRGTSVPTRVQRAVLRGLAKDPHDRWPRLETLLDELEHDPGPARRRWLVGGLTVGVLGSVAGWQTWERDRNERACETEGTEISLLWNEGRKQTIAEAMESTRVSYAVDSWQRASTHLDGYAEQWSHDRSEACRATMLDGVRTPAALDLSRTCFDERRERMGALLDEFERADPTMVVRVATVTVQLPSLDDCTDDVWLARRPAAPEDPELKERFDELRRALQRASAVSSTGHYAQALEEAEKVVTEAESLGAMPLLADAQLAVARALQRQGEYERAITQFETAFITAGGAGHDMTALDAASNLTFLTGYQQAEHEQGLHWAAMAEMFVTRLQLEDDPHVALWLTNLGSVHQARGKYDEALAVQRRALQMGNRIYVKGHPRLAVLWSNLANALHGNGDYEEAIAAQERAMVIREVAIGPTHPDLAQSLLNLGVMQHTQGNTEDAIETFERSLIIQKQALGSNHPLVARTLNNLGAMQFSKHADAAALAAYERALEIQRETLGEDHHDLAGSYNNIGRVLARQGQYEEALKSYQRALEIRRDALGPDHPHVGRVYSSIGQAHRLQGQFGESVAAYEQALAIWEAAFDPDHPKVAVALHGLGRALVESGEASRATEVLERGLKIREKAKIKPADLAQTRFWLAQAILVAKGDRVRAMELAEQAREVLRVSSNPKVLAEIEAWFREYGPTPG
ncbi:MAG: tetratricopeptide repeat protein [Myxococcota bacterium]